MRARRPLFPPPLLAATALCATLAGTAGAQTLPSLDTRTWRPSTDPGAGLVLEPVTTTGAGNRNVAVLFDYAHRPVTAWRPGTDEVAFRPVKVALTMNLVGSVGLGSRAAVGLSLPIVLYQQGTEGLPPTVHATGNVPPTVVGDVGIHGKATIIPNDGGGFGLAGLAVMTLPTGDRTSFAGEGAMTVGARLLAEYTLVIASAQASLGYTMRTGGRTWPDASAGGLAFGDVVPWTFGVSLKPGVFKIDAENRQRWDVSLHGWLPVTPVGPFGAGDPGSARETPLVLNLSDRIALGRSRDVYALAGVDIGLTDAVGVPAFRVVAGIGWAPREHDQDHDGVPDDVDQCPELPEDRDGFEDADGCPDVDNDDDGILDREDACRNVPGVESGDPKKNGCPVKDVGGTHERDGDGAPDATPTQPSPKAR
jgi:OmpA-OmpF porin, OOP family